MRPRNHDAKSRSWLWSKWFMGAVLLVFLLFSVSLAKEFFRNREINHQIEDLKKEISQLESANQENEEFVEYLKTDLYLEEQARIKLGMRADGEKTIVLQEGEYADETTEQRQGGIVGSGVQRDTLKLWLEYFWGART